MEKQKQKGIQIAPIQIKNVVHSHALPTKKPSSTWGSTNKSLKSKVMEDYIQVSLPTVAYT